MGDGRFTRGVGNPGWVKGVSGNPGGRAKRIDRQLLERYGDDVITIVEKLVQLAKGEDVAGYEGIKPHERLTAAHEAIDRINGKAKQEIDLGGVVRTRAIDLTKLTNAHLEALASIEEIESEDEVSQRADGQLDA